MRITAHTPSAPSARRAAAGFSLIELLIVCALIGILGAMAIPQMYQSRRMIRSAAFNRHILTQLRVARQQAMTERRAITFQYLHATTFENRPAKIINLITHPPGSATALMGDPNYPNTVGSTTSRSMVLTLDHGLPANEMVYGRPPGAPTGALGDGTTMTAMPTNNTINITFQPDGSVVNAAGNATNFALYFYNDRARNTAGAISVLGGTGRVKLWRYNDTTNTWVE